MSPLSRISEHHQQALAEAFAYIEKRYEPWAVVAAGTIVLGNADERSDLDLYVLHDAPYRQRVQRWFQGVPAEIFVNPESAVLGYIERGALDGRPCTAHMLATGVVLLVTDDTRLEALRRRAQESLDTPPKWSDAQLVSARYGPATLVEDALDKREVDAETAIRLLGEAMDATLSYWFKSHGRYVPRPKDRLAEIEANDPQFGRLFRRFWGDYSLSERWDAALELADRILETRGFFDWESAQEPV